MVKPRDLYGQIQSGSAPILLDVRLPKEWMGLRIAERLLNIPIDRLSADAKRLDPNMPVMTICNSAYRSSMGASVLLKAGFKDVRNLEGGGQAWIDAGLPTFSSKKGTKTVLKRPEAYVGLPERISPRDLAQTLLDLPGSMEIVDIRPDWQFKEYHIPDSANVPLNEIMHNPSYHVGKRPLVIVCRDGSIAAAVAGAIFSKTERPVKYLIGGVARYWDEIMRPAGIISDTGPPAISPLPKGSAPGSSAREMPKTSPPPAKSSPPKKKRKRPSAGC